MLQEDFEKIDLSHPSRVRGLKSEIDADNTKRNAVAPFAGAWIEMSLDVANYLGDTVAPFAGAWIEMHRNWFLCRVDSVAPFAGAWIEINSMTFKTYVLPSHPSRVRGLK